MTGITAHAATRFTIDEYFAIVETCVLPEDDRIELLEGRIGVKRGTLGR